MTIESAMKKIAEEAEKNKDYRLAEEAKWWIPILKRLKI